MLGEHPADRLDPEPFTIDVDELNYFRDCDEATLNYVSRLLGKEDVTRRSTNTDLTGGRRSVSETTGQESLTPWHVLREAETGTAVLIHANLPPAHLTGRQPPPEG